MFRNRIDIFERYRDEMTLKGEGESMIVAIKFKDFKQYLSKIDRLSIVKHEITEYENYHNINEVPDIYDELYVWGVGCIKSEFDLKGEPLAELIDKKDLISNKLFYGQCIEIRVSEQPRFEQINENEELETVEISFIVSLLVREVLSWAKNMEQTEAEEIVSQYINFFDLSVEELIVKGLSWHAKEILTQTKNMHFSHRSMLTETYEEQCADRTFKARINEMIMLITCGATRKMLEEGGYPPYMLTVAYSKISEQQLHEAMVTHIVKRIKENVSKEELLNRGYSEEDYDTAKQLIETENGE